MDHAWSPRPTPEPAVPGQRWISARPPAASNPAPYMVTASLPMVPAMKSPNACGTSASA